MYNQKPKLFSNKFGIIFWILLKGNNVLRKRIYYTSMETKRFPQKQAKNNSILVLQGSDNIRKETETKKKKSSPGAWRFSQFKYSYTFKIHVFYKL